MEKAIVLPEVLGLQHEMLAIRRRIHKCPELKFDLPLTKQLVAEYLEGLGLTVSVGVGVVGLKQGLGDGPCLMFRADMDALPIQETLEIEYKSQNDGAMHACGHDAHVAMLLIAAKIITQKQLRGTVKFVFQPAEEIGAGAQAMVDEGVMEGVDFVYGLHMYPMLSLGDYLISDRYMSSNSGRFHVKVTGRGGHGSAPHLTADPIQAAAHIVTASNSIISRNIDSEYKAVISITCMNGGETFNAIPDVAELQGTTRSYEPEVTQLLVSRLKSICESTAQMFECQIEFSHNATVGPIENSEPCTSAAVRAYEAVSKGHRHTYRPMIGEDFSVFSNLKPACFVLVGCGTPEKAHVLHSPKFQLEEQSMLIGASWWVTLAEQLLSQ